MNDFLVNLATKRNPALAGMLVTGVSAELEAMPERRLVDVGQLSPSDVLARWHKRQSDWQTIPADPTGANLRLYPGGVSVWSGYPGEGKTTQLRQMAIAMAGRGEPTFFASLEEDPEDLLLRLCMVANGLREIEHEETFGDFLHWSRERLYVWGVVGSASGTELLAVIRSLARRGLKQAVIDSLMCLDVANDDFEKQRQFANAVAATARVSGVHIHLVVHPRKIISRDIDPDINDVAGAREIAGIADNVIFVRRGPDDMGTDFAKSSLVHVLKNRHGGWCGKIHAYFRKDFGQVHDRPDMVKPITFCDGRPR
jgi:KaiC/GvpD/RAD55 family RecA-like ATPase